MDDSAVLLGVEQRVRAQVAERLSSLTRHIGAYLATAIRERRQLTGTELLSRPDVDRVLTTVLTGAQSSVESTVRAGYAAAGTLAHARATDELKALRYTPPGRGEASEELAAILATVAAAFVLAATDLRSSVQAAFDAVPGTAAAVAATRILAVFQALDRVTRRLGVRAQAAVVVAVHRGYTDAQNAAYGAYNSAHPSAPLVKQWRTGSGEPCPSCAALDGVTIAADVEFAADATTDPRRRLPVFGRLLGPPRHPNCRCRLVYVATPATRAVRRHLTASPVDAPAGRLTAAEVRRMPSARYRALVAFFTVTARRLTALLRRGSGGG